ncbi:MAG TPA: methyltransferase domain-containing protein [Vicinamibacterales bacterium]|jgi:SAM-dependent methyltransferase|nr:methyltransferase domain-containing protein [Vicinamibacterales bacterium]
MRTTPRVMVVVGLVAIAAACVIPAAVDAQRPTLAPYIPTPQDVVDRMLAVAEVTNKDTVFDLGCGDGRVVITAAKKFGARGVGIDIDKDRISESKRNARDAGVSSLVRFEQGDIQNADVSTATVVALYLVSSANLKLRPLLTKQLQPGARIVSHAFGMGDWQADKVDKFTDARGDERVIYLWRADGKVRSNP